MNNLDHDGWAMGCPIIVYGDPEPPTLREKASAIVGTAMSIGAIIALALGAHWL